ncbi:MAG: caspase family protein [Planctomycetota bacterium]
MLIGVRKSGSLQTLHTAAENARAMAAWAGSQQFKHVHVITDEAGRVDVARIKKTITELVDLRTIEQLIVYFSGHGVNRNRSEYWLLTGAPRDSQEAVNVEGSVHLARRVGIPHVVFISDACRTAPEGIQADSVTGSDIFPNEDIGGSNHAVDQFFATQLGRPAYEFKNTAEAVAAYAPYTDELIKALSGDYEPPLEHHKEGRRAFGLVRPHPLKRHLHSVVTRKVHAVARRAQAPDALITSDESAWLAKILFEHPGHPTKGDSRKPRRHPFVESPQSRKFPDLGSLSRAFLTAALRAAAPAFFPQVPTELVTAAVELGRSVARMSKSFGSAEFRTGCGFKVRGNGFADATSLGGARVERSSENLVQILDVAWPASNVLITFGDGTGTMLPAIPEFIGALTFEGNELVDVAYEPSAGSSRWKAFQKRRDELRRLRATIAESARLGVFRVEEPGARKLIKKLRYGESIDPGLALYAAYACRDLPGPDRILDFEVTLLGDLGLSFFDLWLIGGELGNMDLANSSVFPFFPMLSQGWALLDALRVKLPESLSTLQGHLRQSLWTLFDPAGVSAIRKAIPELERR